MNKHSASDKYLLSAAFESCLLPDYSKHNELQLVFDGSPSFESSEIFACKTVVLPSDKYIYINEKTYNLPLVHKISGKTIIFMLRPNMFIIHTQF